MWKEDVNIRKKKKERKNNNKNTTADEHTINRKNDAILLPNVSYRKELCES